MRFQTKWICKTCSAFALQQVESFIHHNGTAGACTGCGTKVARMQCNQDATHQFWLPLLEAAVTTVCPWCAPVLDVSEEIQQSPDMPEWVKGLAQLVFAGVLIGGTAVVLDKVLASSK